jgi:hypothetical protein
MEGKTVSAQPDDIPDGHVGESGERPDGISEKERNLLNVFEQAGKEVAREFVRTWRPIISREYELAAQHDRWNWVLPEPLGLPDCPSESIRESEGIESTQTKKFMNLTRRLAVCLIRRESGSRTEIPTVAQGFGDEPAPGGSLAQ